MIAFETRELAKHFGGVYAVDHLSIAVRRGAVTAIIGPNGSGKTTFLNTLCGMLPMDGGALAVGGVTLARLAPYEAPVYGITRTFQEIRLWNQMPVLDNVLLALTERNVFGALFERHTAYHLRRAEEILRRVHLWEKHAELAVNLSYGQRKLLEIGRALAVGAEIYLLDEPFAGLFPEMRKVITGVVDELRAAGRTVVLIEHDMGLIRELADEVFVLDSGRLLAHGSPAAVLGQREVVEAYLGV